MRRMTFAGGLAIAASTFALIAAPVAGATTYNNDAPIIIPGAGAANPYPSSITVSGTAAPITDVNVGLDGFTHTNPSEVGIVLVAPGGRALLVMDCSGDETDAAGVFLTFDDAATDLLSPNDPLSSGTFRPTSLCMGTTAFPAPGPLAFGSPDLVGDATFASEFNGQSAIGTWNLFVVDHENFDVQAGSIPGGWSLDVHPDVTPLTPGNPAPTPTPTPTPKKCKKKKGKTSAAAAKKRCKKKKK